MLKFEGRSKGVSCPRKPSLKVSGRPLVTSGPQPATVNVAETPLTLWSPVGEGGRAMGMAMAAGSANHQFLPQSFCALHTGPSLCVSPAFGVRKLLLFSPCWLRATRNLDSRPPAQMPPTIILAQCPGKLFLQSSSPHPPNRPRSSKSSGILSPPSLWQQGPRTVVEGHGTVPAPSWLLYQPPPPSQGGGVPAFTISS